VDAEKIKSFTEKLVTKFMEGKITRRQFFKLAAESGVTMFVIEKLGMGFLNPATAEAAIYSIDAATQALIDRAGLLGIDIVWDRYNQQTPLCNYEINTGCCTRCLMGPCRLAQSSQGYGTCGADSSVIISRNFVRHTAGGASTHVDHARKTAHTLKGIGEGTITGYSIKEEAKLRDIAVGLGINIAGLTTAQIAVAVADVTLDDLTKDDGTVPKWLECRAMPERQTVWASNGILPTGACPEMMMAMNQTTVGMDGDYENLLLAACKHGLIDGYSGLHPASALQDIMFGIPGLVTTKSNLTVIDQTKINLVVNGHEPLLSEKVVEKANAYNATHTPQINVVGMCCTGNEVLMRHGVKLAGDFLQQELAIVTGAVEAMVVDVQCIMPSVQPIATNFHTKIITTNPLAKIPGSTYIEFEEENADAIAQQIIDVTVANYANRVPSKVYIPAVAPNDIMAGFSTEQIVAALNTVEPGDPIGCLCDQIINGNIRGIVAMAGCVTPKDTYGYRHVTITKDLIANNVLVVGTGCWTHVASHHDLLKADPAYPGVGTTLASVLNTVATANGLTALPACWAMGSCVDNSRIEEVLRAVAERLSQPDYLNRPVKISELPVAASAPEYMSEKALAIGMWVVSLGVLTHIGFQPNIIGSSNVATWLTSAIETRFGGKFYVEGDPTIAAPYIRNVIEAKRIALGI
jgi:carbon-monoxide dehydrogenase catalytic subunit